MVLKCIRHQEEWDYVKFLNALRKVLSDLNEQHNGIFVELVEELLDRVALFGSHFASIDIRQDSREIKRAFDALSEQLGLEAPQTPAELFALQATWDGSLTGDNRIDDTLQSFRVIREIQAKMVQKVRTVISSRIVGVRWMQRAYSPWPNGQPLETKRSL